MKKKTLALSGLLILLLMCTACTTLSYSPKVSLDVSPLTINRTVQVEKFTDSSNERERKNPVGGYAVTNKTALSGDLALEVTNAIISDFSINSVFRQISRKPEKPDLILKGEVKKYLGKSRYNTYGLISLFSCAGVFTWYLGMPIKINETDLELIVSVFTPEGRLLGTYTGQYKDKIQSSMYRNIALSIPSQTNKSLSNAVAQIREQLIRDSGKFNQAQ